MNHAMTWADFYLICFAVGFCLSFFSFVFGGARSGRVHLPHFHGGAQLPSGPVGHAPVGGGHVSPGSSAGAVRGSQSGGISPFNFVTLTAFLAWFGGTGYLLTRYSAVWVGFGLLASIVSGLVGGGIVFLFLTKVLMSHEEFMDPADYEMAGVLGRVCSPIRARKAGIISTPARGARSWYGFSRPCSMSGMARLYQGVRTGATSWVGERPMVDGAAASCRWS
jgi:hypothetical protein